MKKIIIAAMFVAVSVSTSAMAGDLKFPLDSASSNAFPNNQKVVEVVERANLNTPVAVTSSQKMTVEQLVSDRPTIQYADMKGGSILCTKDGSTCVSAEKHSKNITIATFSNGTGAPMNVHSVSRKSFDEHKMFVKASHGAMMLECQVVDGRNTGNCRTATSM